MIETATPPEEVDLRTVELELDSLTLGEILAVELASGESFDRLVGGITGQKMMAVLIDEIRSGRLSTSSERRRYWNALASRPLSVK